MENIGDLLSSISPEDMEKLKGVAASLMNSPEPASEKPQNVPQNSQSTPDLGALLQLLGGNSDELGKLTSVIGAMSQNDERTEFIRALKPLLSEDRRQKADEALKFLRLMDILPLLKGLF